MSRIIYSNDKHTVSFSNVLAVTCVSTDKYQALDGTLVLLYQ